MKITIDFETQCLAKLPEVGAYRYCEDESFAPQCCAVLTDEGDRLLWALRPVGGTSQISKEALWNLLESADEIEAHNANFERCGIRRMFGADLPISKFRCSAAKARAMGLPGALDKAALALGLDQQKDKDGQKAMRKVCVASKAGFSESQEDYETMVRYCIQDVATEHALSAVLPPLSKREQAIWELDQKINDRGITIDLSACESIVRMMESEEARLVERMATLTGGAVVSGKQPLALKAWLHSRGHKVKSANKEAISKLESKDATILEVLAVRKELALSSVAKIKKMLGCACLDGKVRGTLMYYGASTGRWSGRLIQPQNLKRSKLDESDMDEALTIFQRGDPEEVRFLYGSPFALAANCLRGLITASPGHRLIVSDFSSIEARKLAWLAGEEENLEAFRQGKDAYVKSASGIYHVPEDEVTPTQRQIGKVAVLACGYQGGHKAFSTMGQNYGVIVPEDEAREIVNNWRQANRKIVAYWYALEGASRECVETGESRGVGCVTFSMYRDWLQVSLPIGRKLSYYRPSVELAKTPWGAEKSMLFAHREVSLKGNDTVKRFQKASVYGGLLAENITQASCRDLMAGAMMRLEAAGYPITLTVHDEVVSDVPAGHGSQEEFDSILSAVPRWAKGLPLGAKGWTGFRYRKD